MQIAPSECVATMHKKDSRYGYSFLFKEYNKKIANLCRLTTWSLVGLKQDSKKSSDYLEALNPFICGENRIRTCEPVSPVTRFPGVPLQPLEHLSFRFADAKLVLYVHLRVSEKYTNPLYYTLFK